MTIDEKKKLLEGFCENRDDCVSCPLKDELDTDCINFFECSDDAVEKAYNLVFGGESEKIRNCRDCQYYDLDEAFLPCRECKNYNCFKMANPVQREEINHPDRYAGGKFECIDVMLDVFGADAVKHFCILNAFKYVWRAEKKNGIEDIKKAVWYLNKYIELGGERNA